MDRFHADFTIQKLEKSDAVGVPSTTYQVIVNTKSVPLAPPKDAAPSFKTALSAGDRNTLALAFFFALLDKEPHLADVIVVIDDPLSSLDGGRSHVTVQETRKLLGKAKQLVVLSHSLPLMLSLWDRCDRASTATLKICDSGVPDESSIQDWDADAGSVRQIDDSTLHWKSAIGGVTKEWTARITEHTPGERIAWTDAATNAGVVTFHRLSDSMCRVTLQVEYEPEGLIEDPADALDVVSRRAKGDLDRFKEFIERRGCESGALRGTIPSQDVRGWRRFGPLRRSPL